MTGSHNPKDYNGFKMVLAGRAIHGEEIQRLRRRMEADDYATGRGRTATMDILAEYRARIVNDCTMARPMTIAVDSGNGIAGASAPGILRALGCTVRELYSEVDGDFPNHHPDPSKPENLAELIDVVRGGDAELGLAFDGDGDRLGVVTKDGQIIYPDRQLMLFARDILKRRRGATILYDVKCSQQMAPLIRAAGGVPMMWKTGHSLVKAKMREIGAPLAGEMSGHIFFGERWYGFDDATYTAARLLEIVSASADPSAVLNALPTSFSTPELNVPCVEGEPAEVVARLRAEAKFPGRARDRHHRRRARRVRRRLRPRPRVEHDAGAGPALRGNDTRGAGAHPGRLHGRAACGQARRAGRGGGALKEGARAHRAPLGAGALRILIVKLSSLGDVVHSLPVVADLRAAYPRALIDWVVEPAFAPLLQRTDGIAEIIDCPLRRWTKAGLFKPSVVREMRAFVSRLRREHYDAIVDLQGLTKSAVIARLARGGAMASPIAPTVQATRRRRAGWCRRRSGSSRTATRSTGRASLSRPRSARESIRRRRSACPHARRRPRCGRARWCSFTARRAPTSCGRKRTGSSWAVASPMKAGRSRCRRRAARKASARARSPPAIGGDSTVWPQQELGAFIDRLAATDGAIGIDSGPSHIAVALGLPHVQLYNFPTSWRTGPQARHSGGRQVAVEGDPVPTVAAVWAAWKGVQSAARAATGRLPSKAP